MGPSGRCQQGGPHNGRPAVRMYRRPIRTVTLSQSAQLVFSHSVFTIVEVTKYMLLQKTEESWKTAYQQKLT